MRLTTIKSSLSRAIEHELRMPGELASFLEYTHLMAANRRYERELIEKKKQARRDENKVKAGLISGEIKFTDLCS